MIDASDIRIDDLPPEFRDVADAIGFGAALRLVEVRGGEAIYIPKMDKLARFARDRAIRAEFTGCNHRELARKYNLTVVMIRRIVGGAATGDDEDSCRPMLPGFD